MAQGQGQWTSKVPYKRFAQPASGATFGPFAANPSEAVDAILVTNTLTALTITGSDGVTITFAVTFPPAGTVMEISPTSITFAPAAAIAVLYR
jgi:hypothetical protein